VPHEVRYAWNGDVSLAYETVGTGAPDILFLAAAPANLDVLWESERYASFLHRLAEGRRLILTDRRGTGLSDRFSASEPTPVESLTDDLTRVLDATRSDRAVILAGGENGMIAQYFAAAHPERCAGLVMIDPATVWRQSPDTPWMPSDSEWEEIFAATKARWGIAPPPQPYASEEERDWHIRLTRATQAPGALVAEMRRWTHADTRDLLPAIRVPTLILADAAGTGYADPASSRYIAARIPSSRVALYSLDDWWFFPTEQVLDEIARFIPELESHDPVLDRVLATVLFTDIVGSTATAVELGDRAWRDLLEQHHAIVRDALRRWRGEELDVAGDGFLARFDGPARAIRCAGDITTGVRDLGLEIRAGVHTGECEVVDGGIGGIAVHLGARIAAQAGPGEVLVSSTVRDLVAGSGIGFVPREVSTMKGFSDDWTVYAVDDAPAPRQV
jgi:class 3 adenylate cyclase/pimeloyl-ACP methyl ester carboxylesterase